MPYGPYDAFANNAFSTFLGIGKFRQGREKEPDKEQLEAYKQAIEMAQDNAKSGVAPQFQFEQTQTQGGKQALRMTGDSTKLYNMLGGETSVRGYEARAAQKMQELDFNQRMMVFDKTEKAFEYLKKLESQEGISPDAKKAVRNLFIDGAGKVGIDLNAYKNANISELEEGWKTGQTNKLSELFNTWQKDPTPQNESFFLSALSKGGKAVDKDVWKTAYTTEKAKVDKRPYKVGQVLPAERNGNVFETKQVTGYDDKNMPIFRTIAKSPIREGEGEKATAKTARLNQAYKVYDEKWVEIAKSNPGVDAKAINSLFNSDELGGGVNSGRLRNALTPDQRKNYDWGKKRVEAHAASNAPAESVDRALTEIQKASKGSSGGGQPKTSNAPPVKYLKEGQQTTFKNGEVWTLVNGKPVRVK